MTWHGASKAEFSGLGQMKRSYWRINVLQLIPLAGCLVLNSYGFDFGGANDITAVSGRTSMDYVRTRQSDGSFTPETYAFAQGGSWKGAKADSSIDKLTFLDVAHVIALPLASQNYLPSKDPKTAKLLIMVYWGTTHAPEHASESGAYVNLQAAQQLVSNVKDQTESPGLLARIGATGRGPESGLNAPNLNPAIVEANDALSTAMAAVGAENRIREQEDFLNVKMLGYDSWWDASKGDHRGTALDLQRNDLLNEIEEDRYFVVLMAYDFQLLWKGKKHKLLWETRFSVRQRHHDFDKDLPAMAQYASQFFGQDSHGLIHKEIPLGHVDIGEVRTLGEVPDQQNAEAVQPTAKTQGGGAPRP